MNTPTFGLPLHTEPVDSLMHLKARLAVLLQKELLRQASDSISSLAEQLHTDHQTVSDLLVLKTGNVSLTDLRHFLLALKVPMQKIECYLLMDCS